MMKRTKLWTSMQVMTIAGATILTACEKAEHTETPAEQSAMPHASIWPASSTEGEGEGNEPENNVNTNDIAYLTQLGLMRGHLLVGYALYQAGHIEHAKTHMKHPKSELYADIEPAFTVRGTTGFADELLQVTTLVSQGADKQDVANAYSTLNDAIRRCENAVAADSQSASAQLNVAKSLLRIAGEEYAIAVVDGKMENAHEYQDAYGFTEIAKSIVENAKPMDKDSAEAVKKAKNHIDALSPLWPSLIPPDTLESNASSLYGAAARIEILALGTKG